MKDAYLLLLSGPIAVGKTALRDFLVANHQFDYVRSGRFLTDLANQRSIGSNRTALQDLGDSLDLETSYSWLYDEVIVPASRKKPDVQHWIVDAVRKPQQVRYIRSMREDRCVLHVHLTAPEDVLEKRYEERRAAQTGTPESLPYAIAINHSNERTSRDLHLIADEVCDTTLLEPQQIGNQIRDWFTEK